MMVSGRLCVTGDGLSNHVLNKWLIAVTSVLSWYDRGHVLTPHSSCLIAKLIVKFNKITRGYEYLQLQRVTFSNFFYFQRQLFLVGRHGGIICRNGLWKLCR